MKGILKKGFQSELKDGSNGLYIEKESIVEVISFDKFGILCNYLGYSFYYTEEYLEMYKPLKSRSIDFLQRFLSRI